ncbi:hypothetical protein C240_727 [Enterococcus sp. 5H]|nr:hypothetical protein [Enterococcus sp. 5H]
MTIGLFPVKEIPKFVVSVAAAVVPEVVSNILDSLSTRNSGLTPCNKKLTVVP